MPETCAECGKTISGRAAAMVFDDQIVCTRCHDRLTHAREREGRAATFEPAPASDLSPGVGKDARPRDYLAEIIRLAEAHRIVCLGYKSPGERTETLRHVEPYRLQQSTRSLMVQCWQLSPESDDGYTKWRNFRLDRITSVCDGGEPFEPRVPVTLGTGEVSAFEWGQDPTITLGPAAEYFRFIESAMLDGRVTDDEIVGALQLGFELSPAEKRGAHARVFANVLTEVLQDSEVSEAEASYLASVREFLGLLGWAP